MSKRDPNETPPESGLRILGIETSGRGAEVALLEEGDTEPEVIAVRELPASGVRNAQSLIPVVRELFLEADISPQSCDAVAVSHGPGSFTGLRIGIVFAKTFAYATGCRLTAVETFQAIAMNAPGAITSLHVIADAQRNGLFVGKYERDAAGIFQREGDIQIQLVESFSTACSGNDDVTGPGLTKYAEDLNRRCAVLREAMWHPSAEVVARLGLLQLAAGQEADCWSLQPFYLRKSAAEEKWDASHSAE